MRVEPWRFGKTEGIMGLSFLCSTSTRTEASRCGLRGTRRRGQPTLPAAILSWPSAEHNLIDNGAQQIPRAADHQPGSYQTTDAMAVLGTTCHFPVGAGGGVGVGAGFPTHGPTQSLRATTI